MLPITAVVLTGLFWIQRYGTGAVGRFFGPIMCAWFGILAKGIIHTWEAPAVLAALNPVHAVEFLFRHPWVSFLALGAIVLAVTGGEALYTDMGHFGKFPIRAAWFSFVLPALVLNYYGQGALLLQDPGAIQNPFYLLAPGWALIPMVALATAATVTASQAVISGRSRWRDRPFNSATCRGCRSSIPHMEAGQIYIPFTNWTLYLAVMALVFGFQSSSNLAAAHGIAVTGTMMIDMILVSFVVFLAWRWNPLAGRTPACGATTDRLCFLLRQCHQTAAGGWFPIVIALASFTTLTTWRRGWRLLFQEMGNLTMPLDQFIHSIENRPLTRVSSTAIYLTSRPEAFLRPCCTTSSITRCCTPATCWSPSSAAEIPHVAESDRVEVVDLGQSFYRCWCAMASPEQPDLPRRWRHAGEGPRVRSQYHFFPQPGSGGAQAGPPMMLWREIYLSGCCATLKVPLTSSVFHQPRRRIGHTGRNLRSRSPGLEGRATCPKGFYVRPGA